MYAVSWQIMQQCSFSVLLMPEITGSSSHQNLWSCCPFAINKVTLLRKGEYMGANAVHFMFQIYY
jgi:hypothetical protein